MLRFAILPVLAFAFTTGCCTKPWDAQPMGTAPDAQCRVGQSTHGYDLYVWDCVDDEHVVVSFYSAEMSCAQPEKESVACGELTDLEVEFASQLGEACEAPPDSLFWE
jgi:hypothetical protein